MKLLRERKGVSPVIGVILMVAITVILAAVIASFVFGMSSKIRPVPQVQIMLSDSGPEDNIRMEHYGGDPIDLKVTKIMVANATGEFKVVNTTQYIEDVDSIFELGDVAYIANNSYNYTLLDSPNGTMRFSAGTYTVRLIDTVTNTVIFEGRVTIAE